MITTAEMYRMEKECDVPTFQLMENAGLGIYEALKKKFTLKNKKVVLLCGHGNNGGDGFVAAKWLRLEGKADVRVILLGDENKLGEDAKYNFDLLSHNIRVPMDENLINGADILIDAMLGTGIKGGSEIREPLSSAIDMFNAAPGYKVAVDVPTGLDPDTGQKANKVINPDLVLTMHDIKPGLLGLKNKTIIVPILPKGITWVNGRVKISDTLINAEEIING